MGNLHQKCCEDSADVRAKQSRIMMEWIKKADIPVILGGDFNIPIEPRNRAGNEGSASFRVMTETLRWQRPANPIKTHCGEQSMAMLDHFFTSPSIDTWSPRAEIVMTTEKYCRKDNQGYADHRPVILKVDLP